MGKGGKSVGKALFTIGGFFLGGGFWTGLHAANWLSGAVLGASLGSSIWSATHKPNSSSMNSNSPDIQRFDKAQETMSSSATLPVVYGYRKITGNQTFHETNADQNTLHKHVVLCEGGIEGIENVSANDLLIPTNGQTKNTVFTIQNTMYQDATVYKQGKHLYLYCNGITKDLYLANKDDASNIDTLWSWQTSIPELITYINKLGNGWQAFPTATTSKYPGDLWDDTYVETVSIPKRDKSFYENGFYYEFQSSRLELDTTPEDWYNIMIVVGTFKKYDHRASAISCYKKPINFDAPTITGGTNYTFYDSITPKNYVDVGGYPKMAWLDMNFVVSNELNGNPTVSCFVKGRKVYDTRTGETKYSTNPAMCLRDFILSKRFGLGKWITRENIDEDSFKEVADYCDEIITYKGSSGETISCKRYELNIVIDQRQSALDWISDILGNFCGFLVCSQDKLFLKIEKPENIVYKFNDSNSSDLSVAPLALDDTPNRYTVSFIDPLNNWNSVEAIVEDFADQKNRGKIIEKSVSLEGTTSQNQALRLARFYRDYNSICFKTISFKTGQQAMHLEPGDIIDFSFHNVFQNEPFRITEIKENNDGTFEISARNYNKNIYNDYLGATIQVYNYGTKNTSLIGNVPEIKNATFSQDYYINSDGSIVSDLTCNFDLPTYDYFHRVFIYYYGYSEGEKPEITDSIWTYFGSTTGSSFTINNVKTNYIYGFKLVVENTSGRRSSGIITDEVFITGKDNPPSDVTEGRIWYNPTSSEIKLIWTKVSDKDLKFYEIQDENNEIIGNTTLTSFSYQLKDNQAHSFYIYAVDNAGNKSTNPLILIAQREVACEKPLNFIAVQDNINLSQINLSWDIVQDDNLKEYVIYVNGEAVDTTKNTNYKCLVSKSNTYVFGVSSRSIFDAESEINKQTLFIKIEPEDVETFSMVQLDTDRSNLQFKWGLCEHGVNYEIREGTDWENGKFITKASTNNVIYQLRTEGNYKFMIKAIGYNNEYSVNAKELKVNLILRPDAITNIVITQNSLDRSELVATWTPPSGHDIAGYEIYIDNIFINTVLENKFSYKMDKSKLINLSVIAYTVANFKSIKVSKQYYITVEPLDIDEFNITQNPLKKSEIHLSWEAPNELDINHYELRLGNSWDNAKIISSSITNTYYDYIISEEKTYKFWLKAVSTAGYYSLYPAYKEIIFDLNPAPVENLKIYQDISDTTLVNVTWDSVNEADISHYEVRYGYLWDNAKFIGNTNNTTISFRPNTTDTNIKVMVKSVNSSGFYSTERSASLSIKYEPDDVTGFIAYQNGDYVEFMWDKVSNNDVIGYEIREGYSWNTATLIATMITGLKYEIKVSFKSSYKYFIKAINRAGFYSVNASTQILKIDNLSEKNIILNISEIARKDGSHDNTEFANSIYNWQTLGGRFSDWENLMFNETGNTPSITEDSRRFYLFNTIGGKFNSDWYINETFKSICLNKVLRLKKQNDGTFYNSGIYTCKRLDLKEEMIANISVKFHSTASILSGVSARIEIRVSKDGENWTEWRVFTDGQYSFRYIDFRCVMSTEDINKTPEVNEFEVYIDVPDREETGSLNVPIGGMIVTYQKAFNIIPIVTPYALGYGIRCEINDKTLTNFKIRVLDVNGNDVGGNINYRARGY